MTQINDLKAIQGGSTPYCDGKETGQRVREWFSDVWDSIFG